MGFFSDVKEKIKREKEQRDYYNSPDSVKVRLANARAEQKKRLEVARERSEYLKEKAELKRLESEGKFTTKAKEYLAKVKMRREALEKPRTVKVKGKPTPLNTGVSNNNNSPFMPSGRNVMYDESDVRNSNVPKSKFDMFALGKSKANEISASPKGLFGSEPRKVKAKKSKTIVIKI